MKLILFAVSAIAVASSLPPEGQLVQSGLTLSVSPQGAEALRALTGKRIKGVQILSMMVCSDIPANVSGGRIYQAVIGSGISTISPRLAPAIINGTVNRNWRKFALEAGKVATLVVAGMTTSGIITASTRVTTGLIIAHQAGDQISGVLQSRIPDPAPLLNALLDPSADITLNARGCREGLILAIYNRATRAQVITIE